MDQLESAFCGGVIYGAIAAGVLGFILVQIRAARKESRNMYRTLDTWSDAQQPHLTPAKIVNRSVLSTLGCAFWLVMFFFAAYGLYYLYFYLVDQIH
jgi:hypothetical protein